MRQRDPGAQGSGRGEPQGGHRDAPSRSSGSNVAQVKADNIAGAVAAQLARALDADALGKTRASWRRAHELRQAINGHIRQRLAREGPIRGPAMASERLVSRGYTNAEKAACRQLCAAGDVVAFHRPYKRDRRREGRRAPRRGRRSRGPVGDARRRQTAGPGGLEAGRGGRAPRGNRGLQGRGDRAARGRPHPLDPQRCGSRAHQQPHGGGRRKLGGGG